MFHTWNVFEDITVCVYAVMRKNDPKSIKRLSKALGISESKIAYRMGNYIKLLQGKRVDWHYSRQERKVFDWVMGCSAPKLLTFLPAK